jgi:hypothetical protein
MMRTIALAILLLVVGGEGALAGSVIETEARDLGSDPLPTRRGVVNLEPERMRLDVPEASSTVIYRGDLDLVWIVDHRDRTFVLIDRATMNELSRRMAEAKAELRARLAAMPPELRGSMERLLGEESQPGAERDVEIAVRETGRTERLDDLECTEFELRRREETIAVACTAEWESAAVEPESFRPIGEMGSFLRRTLSVMPVFPDGSIRSGELDALDAIGRLDGVPLRIRILEAGTPIREVRVTSIEQKDLAAETFEVPAGYQQSAVPFR